jgi:peptidoglycan/xylan/chitin deacetylase (PgdA/CDA1 family)
MKTKNWIIGGMFFLFCLPAFAANVQGQQIKPLCRTTAHKGTVALTFDDGPSKYTKRVLAILEHYHIKATFFVLGRQVKKHPQYLMQMIKDGDVIGDHSMSHPLFSKLSSDNWYNEVVNSKKIIHEVIGKDPEVFRLPYGAGNDEVKKYVREQGMQLIYWGYTPEDFRRPGAQVIANKVVENARSGQVILLHDGPSRREQTVKALPMIIRGIQKKGLGFSVICT